MPSKPKLNAEKLIALFNEYDRLEDLARREKVTPRSLLSGWLRLQRQGRLPLQRPRSIDNTGDYVPIEEPPQPIEPPPEFPDPPDDTPAPQRPARRPAQTFSEHDGRPSVGDFEDPLLEALIKEHKHPRYDFFHHEKKS
jgi:hypothetical protein